MSREIKFRAWNIKLREWNDGLKVLLSGTIKDFDWDDEGYYEFEVPKEEYVIEQYTGLKDKNGKEIYEGDIVRYDDEYDHICLAVIKRKEEDKENSFWLSGFVYEPFKIIDEEDLTEEEYENLGGIEVIGNIHENPELLGGKNE